MAHPITVCIPTFARGRLLPDAFASVYAAALRYPAPVEILVYNDLAVQRVEADLQEGGNVSVRVINSANRHTSLGAKRQCMVEMVHHDGWVTWVDDDDLVMPWHLEGLAKISDDRMPFVSWARWYVVKLAADGGVASAEHAEAFGGIVFAARRSRYTQVGGFRPISFGEDNDLRHRLEQLGVTSIPRPSYVCCHRQVRRASRLPKESKDEAALAELKVVLREPSAVILRPYALPDNPILGHLAKAFP